MDQDDGDAGAPHSKSVQHAANATLLPAPIASTISLVTRSTALYLRLGSLLGALALDGARVTTLTGLELSRAIVEGILSRAGRDVSVRSKGELGRAEAEGMLERSISTLHYTITQISFAASTGFHISTAALTSAADLSQHLLATLDAIVGSTDSSRAIASIITLIRREFENPATGKPGEKVGVSDLLIGICGLALLQRWCKRLTDLEAREKKQNDIDCWDVVILDDGRRGDVVGSAGQYGALSTEAAIGDKDETSSMLPLITTTAGDEILRAVERPDVVMGSDGEDEWPELRLKERIMGSLPPEASVSITTETETTKTITVDITGAQPLDLSPPPGVEIVEEILHNVYNSDLTGENLTNEEKIALLIPRYRVVYRTIRNKLRGTSIQAGVAQEVSDMSAPETSNLPPAPESEPAGSASSVNGKPEPFERPSNIASPRSATFSLSPPPSPEPEPTMEMDINRLHGSEKPRSQRDTKLGSITIGPSAIPLSIQAHTANQKRPRKVVSSSSSMSSSGNPQARLLSSGKHPVSKKAKSEVTDKKPNNKKGSIRNALKKGSSVALAGIWSKDVQSSGHHPGDPKAKDTGPTNESKSTQMRPPWGTHKPAAGKATSSQMELPPRASTTVPARDAPRGGNPNYFSSRDLGSMNTELGRSSSRASYYSIHDRTRDSLVSQTDTYSIHSIDTVHPSPTALRTHLRTQSKMIRARSEKNMNAVPQSPQKNHRRSRSYVPSIYTLGTNNSEQSLVLAAKPSKGAYDAAGSLQELTNTGHIDGLFPKHHMVRNVARFIRFASASYGASFMRIMGISTASGKPAPGVDADHHFEHHSFSQHTQLPPSTILLSSFVDPQGGTDSTGRTNTGVPMVHFVSLDHESKAVVLSCRGTLGFEDVLTDMTCDYDELLFNGRAYKVHKGIHASALRLLSGKGSRVLATLATALEEFPDYGLVMCGHSLGGGVTALLAIMISEPSTTNFAFVTASDYQRPQLLVTSSDSISGTAPLPRIQLPPGRPIHVYAYGPPATMSPSLRLATRGLITTIVNGQDLIPYLSLGILHDLQAVALAFKNDDSGAKGEVRARVWAGFASGFTDKWYSGRPSTQPSDEDDQWAYSALKTLRASMLSAKLVPPGEVFCLETTPVLQRDAFTHDENSVNSPRGLGRPATRVVLKYVRHVEKRFGEVRFGGSMLLDHSPGRYEVSLATLGRGVLPGYS